MTPCLSVNLGTRRTRADSRSGVQEAADHTDQGQGGLDFMFYYYFVVKPLKRTQVATTEVGSCYVLFLF